MDSGLSVNIVLHLELRPCELIMRIEDENDEIETNR